MNKLSLSRVIVWLSLLPFVILSSSCMNEEYDMSQKEINLEIAPFQEGVVIPLGSLAPITLGQLIPSGEGTEGGLGDFFKQDELTGGYAFSYSGGYEVEKEQFDELKEMVKIDAFDFSEEGIEFQFSDANVEDISIEGKDYPFEYEFSEIEVPEIKIPSFSEEIRQAAGLDQYAERINNMDFPIDDLTYDETILSFENFDYQIPGADDTEIGLMDGFWAESIKETPEFGDDEIIPVTFTLPDGVNSVGDIVLADGAGIRVIVDVVKSFLTSGSLSPNVTLDLSNICDVEESENDEVNIAEELNISAVEGSRSETFIPIGKLKTDTDTDGWVKNGQECSKEFVVPVSGNAGLGDDLMTTTNQLNRGKTLELALTIKFENFKPKDLSAGIDPITVSIPEEDPANPDQEYMEYDFAETITLPKEIESVTDIVFDENSGLTIDLDANNLKNLVGLDADLDLEIIFPKALVFAPNNDLTINDEGSTVLKLEQYNLVNNYHNFLRITGLNLPDPVPVPGSEEKEISLNEIIKVKAMAVASGTVHSSTLPTKAADDVEVVVKVNSNLVLADYDVNIEPFEYFPEIEEKDKEFKFEVPEELADIKGLVIYPEGKPIIEINISYPEVGLMITPSVENENGGQDELVINFPPMIKLKDVEEKPDVYKYDPVNSTLTLKSVPCEEKIELAVDRLVLDNPELGEDGKYYIIANMDVLGGLTVSGSIPKEVVDRINTLEPVSIVASIPDIVPSTLSIDAFETAIDTIEETFEILKEGQVPEELASLESVELKDTWINILIDGTSLPKLGGETKLSVTVDVALPSEVRFDNGKQGTLTRVGELDVNTGMIEIEPIKVDGLVVGKTREELNQGLSGDIKVDATVKLENASLAIAEWLGPKHKVDLIASIESKRPEGQARGIDIGKVTGEVDYQIEPISETITIGDLSEMLGENVEAASLDFSHIHLALDIETNLCVPVQAEVNIKPYKGETELENLGTENPLVLTTDDNPWDETHAQTHYWLSNDEKGMPGEYTQVPFDLLKYFRDLHNAPDKFIVELKAGTIPGELCVLEPLADYILKADYAMQLPLELGEDLNIVYRQVIPDMPAILGSVLSTGNQVALKGTIENSLPLALDLEFHFLDSNGERVETPDECGKQYIKACTSDGAVNPTDLNVLVGVKKDAPNASDIASLELVFTAKDAVTGVVVKPESSLGATLQVALPKGVTIDLADLLNNENSDEDNE